MNADKISAFCKQISFIIETGIPLDVGLEVMRGDAATAREREMLTQMREDVLGGVPLGKAMENTGLFPDYVIKMSKVGYETGNLDVVMQALAQYYEDERALAKAIRDAVFYPLTMIMILLVVLFVLITKVLPVFDQVYVQLGAQSNTAIKKAIELGGAVTLGLLIFFGALALGFLLFHFWGNKRNIKWSEGFLHVLKQRTKVGAMIAKRRFASVMSLAISSGMDLGAAMELASEIMEERMLAEKVFQAKGRIDGGEDFNKVLDDTEIFSNMELQMIRVGGRTGKLESAFQYLSDRYGRDGDEAIAKAVGRIEPILVVTMTFTVGLILMSVMVPLIEIMASIG
ncbi:MAG: type II secretion system F family protein [Anaerovoracaceae bacterium]